MRVLKRYASFNVTGLILMMTLAFCPSIWAQGNSLAQAETAQLDEKSVKGNEEPVVDELPPIITKELITSGTYPFTALAGIGLEDMSSGTTQLVGPALDDNNSVLTNIGFDFFFDGARFTQFAANANGFVRLGLVPTGNTFTNRLDLPANGPKIASFWDDLCTGTNGQVHYKTTGSPGSRKLIIEWQNMKITRNTTCVAPVGNGTFQMWLFESTGIIQFVYGAIPAPSPTDIGYSIGMQSGVATNLASVTTSDGTVSYTTANNSQLDAIAGGTSYVFTPNIPSAPTGLSFSSVTALTMSLNWTDNATNESGYAIYRSTDGTNFSFVDTTPADITTFGDTELTPNTTYFYRVFAFTEGGLSTALSGSQATNPTGNITAVAAGGPWNSPGTWIGGVVPTSSDVVNIPGGATVTIDTASAAAYELNVGTVNFSLAAEMLGPKGGQAVLVFDAATGQSLSVVSDVNIASDGEFTSAASGTVLTHALSIGGNLTNNGILDFSTAGNAAAADITFVGAENATFGGTGATTDIRTMTVNKGTNRDSILELNTTNFTVQGAPDTADANFLTLTTGTFKLSGTFTGTYETFVGTSYIIPATAGFWLNNPNYTVVGQGGSPSNNGLIRITTGTFNVGTSSGNSLGGAAGGEFVIEGGTLNTAGRLQTTSAVTYTQSGGVVNVCTVANTATTACFGLTATTGTFNMSGGVINLVQINSNATAASRRDYQVGASAGNTNITGGTLNVGTGATTGNAGNFEFRITGTAPSVVIDNTTNPKSLSLAGGTTAATIRGSLTISTGAALNLHNGTTGSTLNFWGPAIVNNGEINGGVATSSRLNFLGTNGAGGGTQTYGGSGTWGTSTTPASGFGILGAVTINSPVITNRVNLFGGLLTGSGLVTLGNGGASATVVQISQAGNLINGGNFDVAPVFNTGTGGHTLLYLPQPSLRTTGVEVPASRSILALTLDNTNNLQLAGGDLTITGTMTLTNGAFLTGSGVITHNGTAARTNGFVDGNLNRSYDALGTYTYHVGQNGYSPVAVTLTALGTTPSSLMVSPTDDFLAGIVTATAVSRRWALTETGDLTATLGFTYLDADVNGSEPNYKVFKRTGGVTTEVAGSTIDAGSNTATVTGITDFSEWGIGEALDAPVLVADIGGRLELSGGRGVSNATIILSNPSGEVHRTQPNQFGYYRFLDVATGVTYTVTVDSKRYTFDPTSQTFTLNADNLGVNFSGTVTLPIAEQEQNRSVKKP